MLDLVMLMKNHNRNAMFIHILDKYDKEKSAKIIDKIYILLGDHHLDKRAEYIKLLEEAGCKYKIIKNAGHGVNHEQPEAVNREIIEFLSNI